MTFVVEEQMVAWPLAWALAHAEADSDEATDLIFAECPLDGFELDEIEQATRDARRRDAVQIERAFLFGGSL